MQLASLSDRLEVGVVTWNAGLPLLHAPPGGHGHAPVTLVVLQQHPAPRLVILHHLHHYNREASGRILPHMETYRRSHPQLLLVAELVDAHQVRHHGHLVPAAEHQ